MSPTPPPLRIAILECDIPIGNTREKYGGYGNLFKELLLKGVGEVRDGKDGKGEGKTRMPLGSHCSVCVRLFFKDASWNGKVDVGRSA